MATACWDFIVAKATPLEPAPTLDISSLRGTNMEIHQQLIHKPLWMCWGQLQLPSLRPPGAGKDGKITGDYTRGVIEFTVETVLSKCKQTIAWVPIGGIVFTTRKDLIERSANSPDADQRGLGRITT